MISYEAYYVVGTKPSIRKAVEASDNTIVYTNLNFSNEDERENTNDEIIIQHINNLHLHLKEVTNSSTLIPVGDPLMTEILIQWPDIVVLYNEIIRWWNYISYRPEEEHDESDHAHDPVTGEHV